MSRHSGTFCQSYDGVAMPRDSAIVNKPTDMREVVRGVLIEQFFLEIQENPIYKESGHFPKCLYMKFSNMFGGVMPTYVQVHQDQYLFVEGASNILRAWYDSRSGLLCDVSDSEFINEKIMNKLVLRKPIHLKLDKHYRQSL